MICLCLTWLQKIIRLNDSFVIFWGHELTINKFKLIDPRQKKHDVGIQKLDNGDFTIHEGVLEICQYYNLKENKAIHMNYVDKDTFLFKVFSAEAIEIDYTSQLVSSNNSECVSSNDAKSSNDGGYDPVDFYHLMSKCLSSNDAKSSSLVTNS